MKSCRSECTKKNAQGWILHCCRCICLNNVINNDRGSENEEASYPQRAPLTELEHAKHAVLKLHRAVELGQVVIIDPQQLGKEPGEKWVSKHGVSPRLSKTNRKNCKGKKDDTKSWNRQSGGRLTVLSSILCSSLKSPSVCFSSFNITGWRTETTRRRTQRGVDPMILWLRLRLIKEALLYLLIVAASTVEVRAVFPPVLFNLHTHAHTQT